MKNSDNTLTPLYRSDIEIIDKLKIGDKVFCTIKKARNYNHHKLIFAIAKCILANLPEGHYLENQQPYDIIKAVMLDAGIVDFKMNIDGTPRIEPKSIAFENMNEDEFQPVSDAMFQVGAMLLEVEEIEFRKNVGDYL